MELVVTHPIRSAAAIGLAARGGVAVASFALNRSYLVGDELQYVQLATAVADGRGAEAWFPFYGQSLYDSAWAFLAPISFLFGWLGPSRLIAQLWSAGFGVLTVVLVVVLARRVVEPRLALLAGLVMAMLPSQVLWSSIALRESMIWAMLALVAWGVAVTASDDRPLELTVGTVVLVVALLVLGRLRVQTFVVAVWALLPAVLLASGRRLVARALGATALTVVLPIVIGVGPAGWHLVELAVPSLAQTRTTLALHAETGFTPTTIRPVTSSTTLTAGAVAGPATSTTSTTSTTVAAPTSGGLTAFRADDGNLYEVDESMGGSLRALPRGTVAVLLRPFPWEPTSSVAMLLAKAESVLWWALYALALAGGGLAWRHRRTLAYPVVVVVLISSVAAVTQGNLGTAFRHRGQLAWALVLLAVVGLQAIVDRRSSRPVPA